MADIASVSKPSNERSDGQRHSENRKSPAGLGLGGHDVACGQGYTVPSLHALEKSTSLPSSGVSLSPRKNSDFAGNAVPMGGEFGQLIGNGCNAGLIKGLTLEQITEPPPSMTLDFAMLQQCYDASVGPLAGKEACRWESHTDAFVAHPMGDRAVALPEMDTGLTIDLSPNGLSMPRARQADPPGAPRGTLAGGLGTNTLAAGISLVTSAMEVILGSTDGIDATTPSLHGFGATF